MSLVDYASSSDEDEPVKDQIQVKQDPGTGDKQPRSRSPAVSSLSVPTRNNDPPLAPNRMSENLGQPPSTQRQVSGQSAKLKLPDASLLLNSPAVPPNLLNASDHSSQVAAAMAESAARKRELNGLSSDYPRAKIQKGTLPHSKDVPDTVGGHLLPPQLAGRSNVVTEDISKLFVRKHINSSTQ